MARIDDEVSGDIQTTNGTQTLGKAYTLPDNCIAEAEIFVVARNTSNGDAKGWTIRATFARHNGGDAVFHGENNQSAGSVGALVWGSTCGVSGSDARILDTGVALTTIEWSHWMRLRIRTT